jgi:hypothetical protein
MVPPGGDDGPGRPFRAYFFCTGCLTKFAVQAPSLRAGSSRDFPPCQKIPIRYIFAMLIRKGHCFRLNLTEDRRSFARARRASADGCGISPWSSAAWPGGIGSTRPGFPELLRGQGSLSGVVIPSLGIGCPRRSFTAWPAATARTPMSMRPETYSQEVPPRGPRWQSAEPCRQAGVETEILRREPWESPFPINACVDGGLRTFREGLFTD